MSGSVGGGEEATGTTCPICLESLFQTPLSESTGPSNSSSSRNNYNANTTTTMMIGSTVPCGHCLHVDCWDGWMASTMQQNRHHSRTATTKCPLCNVATSSFVRLYVQPPPPPAASRRRQRQQLDDDDDEEGFDSSDDDSDDEDIDSMESNDEDTEDVADVEVCQPPSATGGHARRTTSNDNNDDDDSIVHLLNYNNKNNRPTQLIIDLCNEESNVPSTSSNVNNNNNNNDDKKQKAMNKRLVHKVKKYQKHIRTLRREKELLRSNFEQKYRQKISTLQGTIQENEETMASYHEKIQTLEQERHTNQLKMEDISLQKVALNHTVNRLQKKIDDQKNAIRKIESAKQMKQQQYELEIEALQRKVQEKKTSNMSEVQGILQERPKLLQQIYTLKETIRQLKEPRTNGTTKSTAAATTTTTMAGAATTSSNHITTTSNKQRTQLLRSLSEGIDNNNNKGNHNKYNATTATSKNDNARTIFNQVFNGSEISITFNNYTGGLPTLLNTMCGTNLLPAVTKRTIPTSRTGDIERAVERGGDTRGASTKNAFRTNNNNNSSNHVQKKQKYNNDDRPSSMPKSRTNDSNNNNNNSTDVSENIDPRPQRQQQKVGHQNNNTASGSNHNSSKMIEEQRPPLLSHRNHNNYGAKTTAKMKTGPHNVDNTMNHQTKIQNRPHQQTQRYPSAPEQSTSSPVIFVSKATSKQHQHRQYQQPRP